MAVLRHESNASRALALLTDQGGSPVAPTERWGDGWRDPDSLTKNPCVYAIYGREIAVTKWLNDRVRDMVERFPGDVGSGSMPGGMDPFTVPNTTISGLGPWVMLYAGESGSVKKPRVTNYFGVGGDLTRELGGQSFHLMLALLFGLPADPRVRLEPPQSTIIDVVRGSVSLSLERRLREMHLGVVQVETDTHREAERELLQLTDEKPWEGARPLMNAEW